MSRTLVFMLLFCVLLLPGCGGGGDGTDATSDAATSVGIRVNTPSSTLTTNESGLAAIISVSLGSKPTAEVTIPVTSSNTKEGTVSVEKLVFTSANWSTVQTITVTGVADTSNDGNQNYTIHLGPAISADSSYNSLEKTLPAINLDVRKASFIVSPSSGVTTESGGSFTFYVSLGYAPSAEVRLPITGLPTEGSLSTDQLIFTTLNWQTPQPVTVTGVGDTSPGDQEYLIELGPAQSTDSTYDNLVAPEVKVTNLNAQRGDFKVTPNGAFTDESGGQVTIAVELLVKPAFPVTIPVECSDPSEATVSTNQLIFTTADWNLPQTITVKGIEDPILDNNASYSIKLGLTASADDNYNGLDPVDVSLTNQDVKTGNLDITPLTLTTSEEGTTATFQVRLTTPLFVDYDATLLINSLNTDEGTVSPAALTFDDSDWDIYKTVTVTGVNDNLADGDITYNIKLDASTSRDDNYSSLDHSYVSVTNTDWRVASFVVTPTSITTDESGRTADFYVSLGSPPATDVTIGVTSDTETEGTVSTDHLTFTNSNWSTPQKVTVTGISDTVFDPDHPYNIVLAAAASSDQVYNGADPPDVLATNQDHKNGVVVVSPVNIYTDESGQSATFTVSLNDRPSEDVTIAITGVLTSEGTVSPTTLTFTRANWAPKTVTVTGVDDAEADGNQTYLLNLGLTSSLDNNFNGLDPADVYVTNVDLVDPYGVAPRISAGYYHNLVLASDGTVWGWGACSEGQLDAVAPATCTGSFTLPQRLNISGASAVSAGNSFSVIVKADGTVWSSGINNDDQLGHTGGGIGSPLTPVDGLSEVETVSAGGFHTLALKKRLALLNPSTVLAWGRGKEGQLGNGASANSPTPVPASEPLASKTVTAIAAGYDHSLALDNAGNVYSWGPDTYEQLGRGIGDQTTATPTAINLLTNVTSIAAGQLYSLAAGKYSTGSTTTYGWGYNNDYQLGTDPTSGGLAKTNPSPTAVKNVTISPTRLDGGYQHSLALVGTDVYAWGDNDAEESGIESWDNRGALGRIASTIDSNYPMKTFTGVSAIDVNAGSNYSLVLLSDGRIQSSGVNNYAQLGTNEIATGSFTATPLYVEDPSDPGTGTIPFYAYRPIISGQPATETNITSATLTVCASTLPATANCGPITHYKYSTNNDTGNGSWYGPYPITTPITASSLTGTVNIWVKGMIGSTETQSATSAVKVSWEVIAPAP